jgi:hypothetical protein
MRTDENSLIVTDEFDPESTAVSTAVVCAVAGVLDDRPREIDPLYDVVDLDALDSIFEDTERVPAVVSFGYEGFDVSVCGSGEIILERADNDEVESTGSG